MTPSHNKYGNYTANEKQGYHQFEERSAEGEVIASFGSFEVFYYWEAQGVTMGWYWWARYPGNMPDGTAAGPFATSQEAYDDAQEET